MNDPKFDIQEFARELMRSQSEMLQTGMKIAEGKFHDKIRALEKAYQRAALDPETKIPSYLMVIIVWLIATLPENYVDAMVKRDQLARHEGRPEHDMSTRGTPLKAGS